jgi:hypothetical protein
MIISPPFLPARAAGATDALWLNSAMVAVAARLPDTHASEGSFPLGHQLLWHNGLHLQAPTVGTAYLPVCAIADGEVVFRHKPQAVDTDVNHAQNYNPFGRAGSAPTAAWTDNGCIIIKHTTEIGTEGNTPTTLVFYSLHMHLSELGKNIPAGAVTGPDWAVGNRIWRKDKVGVAGQVYGHRGQVHFELCFDATNLEALVGRVPGFAAPPVAPNVPPAPTTDGRTDAIFGSVYFYLPANTPTSATEPNTHMRGTGAATTPLGAHPLWVKMTCGNGECTFESFDVNGTSPHALAAVANEEYDLYQTATARHNAVVAAGHTDSSPSGWYELLRFGRNIGQSATARDALPANAAHWRRIPNSTGTAIWADLNAAGTFKFSDADFLSVLGWNFFDDDATPLDQHCDSTHLFELIRDPDATNTQRMEPEKLMERVGLPAVQKQLRRAVCKFPTEWDRDSIDARYGFVGQLKEFTDNPGSWEKFKAHLEAISFTDLPTEFKATRPATPVTEPVNWSVHPAEMISILRKCGWLSNTELLQLIPEHVIRKPGSHNSSTQAVWESPNLSTARTFLTHHGVALSRALRKFGINTPLRQSCFFGNATQETGWFRTLLESNGSQPNLHLGWFGRGFLQLTNPNGDINAGNNNYYQYFKFVGRAPAVPPGPTEIAWRNQVGTNSDRAAQSSCAYWVWPNKSVPTTTHPNRPQVDNACRYADVAAPNQRRLVTTGSGSKVWYYNQSFTNCAAAVNYPGTVGQNPPNMNGLIDRSTAFVNALVVLADVPIFPDALGVDQAAPENFIRQIVL